MSNTDAVNALNILHQNIEQHIAANGPDRDKLRNLYSIVAKYLVDADAMLNQRIETKGSAT